MQVINSPLEKIHHRIEKLMGNRFEITVVSNDVEIANIRINEAVNEIRRIESLLTTFNEISQTNLINRNAGIAPVQIDREVFNIIYRSIKISELTQGAFDISYGSLDKRFWNFDTEMKSLPDPELAKESIRLINYKNVKLNEKDCTVYLSEKGMRIGFGGIGKGYAADMAKKLLLQNGISSGVVNASGDLTVWGTQPGGKKWTIGIADPYTKISAFSSLDLDNMSVATSGNYEKFAVINGKKYSHTINPKTGFPAEGIKSVTIITQNAELADAMTTPVIVMGIHAGLNLINQMKNIECIIIDENDVIHTSFNIHLAL